MTTRPTLQPIDDPNSAAANPTASEIPDPFNLDNLALAKTSPRPLA